MSKHGHMYMYNTCAHKHTYIHTYKHTYVHTCMLTVILHISPLVKIPMDVETFGRSLLIVIVYCGSEEVNTKLMSVCG